MRACPAGDDYCLISATSDHPKTPISIMKNAMISVIIIFVICNFCTLRRNLRMSRVDRLEQISFCWVPMKIVGFALDVSRSRDERIVQGQRVRQFLIRATLDLIQGGRCRADVRCHCNHRRPLEPDPLPAFHPPVRSLCRCLRTRCQPRLWTGPEGGQRSATCQPHRASGFRPRSTLRGMAAGLALRGTRPTRGAGRWCRSGASARHSARANCRVVCR